MGFFTLPQPRIRASFTFNPADFNTTVAESLEAAHTLALDPRVSSGKVTIYPHGNTPEEQAQYIFTYFHSLGSMHHSQFIR